MKKKIALFLIILMVGSWCLYADEGAEVGVGPIVGGILGVALVICLIWWMVEVSSVSEAPKDDSQPSGFLQRARSSFKTSVLKLALLFWFCRLVAQALYGLDIHLAARNRLAREFLK